MSLILQMFDSVRIIEEPERGTWIVIGIRSGMHTKSGKAQIEIINLRSRVSTIKEYTKLERLESGIEETLVCCFPTLREEAAIWSGTLVPVPKNAFGKCAASVDPESRYSY